MFTRVQKWLGYPDGENDCDFLFELPFMEYCLGWKPNLRYLVLTVSSDCVAPHFLFKIMERRIRNLTTEENGIFFNEQLSKDVLLLSVAFYPPIGSEMSLVLAGLADDGFRGKQQEFAVQRVFHYCFWEYDLRKKVVGGWWKRDSNPMPACFPKYWGWYDRIHSASPPSDLSVDQKQEPA